MIYYLSITVQEIIVFGISIWTAYIFLRQEILIMVERGFDFYNNKGLGTVPVSVVAEILGLEELHVKN